MDFYLIDYNLIQIVLAWSMHPTVAHPYDFLPPLSKTGYALACGWFEAQIDTRRTFIDHH